MINKGGRKALSDEFKLCGLTVKRGGKTRGYAQIPASDIKIPLVIINGEKPGPTLLLTAGIHGAEYPGIAALAELGHDLDASEISGSIAMLYPVNIQGFWKRCEFVVPEDEKNLNRVFPGSPRGSLAERTAYMLVNDFFPFADFYADLHSGDIHEELCPHVYYPGQPDENIEERSKRVACGLDMGYMVRSLASGGAYNYAAESGVPSILIERGCAGMYPRYVIDAYKKDIFSVMYTLGMTERSGEPRASRPQDIDKMIYLESPENGCWFCEAENGAFVKKGDTLGRLVDFFCETETILTAEESGVVLYTCSALAAPQGTVLIAYGTLAE